MGSEVKRAWGWGGGELGRALKETVLAEKKEHMGKRIQN